MKTPLQQLIERLEILRDNSEGFSAEIEAYQKAIDEAKSLSDKESNELDEVSKFDETEWTWENNDTIQT